jgi:Fe-S cluster biogenesis protein NfuA
MTKQEEVQNFIDMVLMPVMKKSETTGLDQVQVSIERIDEGKGIVYLDFVMGKGLGCSPVCGCAKKQLAKAIEKLMIEHLPWVKRVVGSAELVLPENKST